MSADTPLGDSPEQEDTAAPEKPKLSLEVKVDKPSSCRRHVTVTVARDDIERYMREAFDELKPKAEVPGFRAGRAPRKLIETRFRDQIAEQIKGELLMDSMTQISEEQDFSAISEPEFDFDAIEVPEEGPMTFEFEVEVRPEFDLPQWRGLKLQRPVRQYSEEDVERQLRQLLSRYGKVVERDGPAEKDDVVTVNITFTRDGDVVSELQEETLRIKPVLSLRDAKLTNFAQLMTGAQKGDRRQETITISQDAEDEQLRGQQVTAAIEVLAVKTVQLPQLNEAFLQKIGDFENEEELREAVRSSLERQATYHQQQRVRQQITAQLTKDADWDLPPDLLRRQARRELGRSVLELRSSGFSDEEIRTHENELRQNIAASTARALKEHFILERIAEEEKIEAENEDFDREIMMISLQTRESPRRVRARLEKRGEMDALRNQIVERKVIELIMSQAEFTEVPLELKPDDTVAVDHAISGRRAEEIPEAKHAEAENLREPADRS